MSGGTSGDFGVTFVCLEDITPEQALHLMLAAIGKTHYEASILFYFRSH
jgi:hypothetical protein